MPKPQAPAIGTHLAALNLFREPDGTVEITVAEGVGALQEIDRVRFAGKPIDYIEARIVEGAVRMFARRQPLPAEQELAEHPAAPGFAYAIAMKYARPLAFARRAMQDFVDKVEEGTARSKRSYAAFKLALGEIDTAFPAMFGAPPPAPEAIEPPAPPPAPPPIPDTPVEVVAKALIDDEIAKARERRASERCSASMSPSIESIGYLEAERDGQLPDAFERRKQTARAVIAAFLAVPAYAE